MEGEELYEVPLDPSVRKQWKVGDRFQVMASQTRGIDYEVVDVNRRRMLVRLLPPPAKPPASGWRRRLSSLAG